MNHSITFNALPFKPEERQVIYVESHYDERTNAIIKHFYERLKGSFIRAGLDFVYLPMFFNDEELREKVLYYAPYLTSEIIQKTELRSSYLLSYMSHAEDRKNIAPSLLYAPKQESDGWVFQVLPIDSEGDGLQWFDGAIATIEEELSVVEKSCSQSCDGAVTQSMVFPEDDEWTPELKEEVLPPETHHLGDRIKRWFRETRRERFEASAPTKAPLPSLDDIIEDDVRDTIEDLERSIERLRLLGVPLTAIVEFVSKYETISRLRLTDDLRILLPDYNNREVKMGPLYKAVYFLFLNHREGIVLQRLEEHHRELVNYYLQTSQKRELTPRMADTINRLEYPGDNTIHIVLSRIKAYFKATIDEHLAHHYYIIGKPGEPYKIALDDSLIEWEDEG